jgi:quercetin 2,3-dioxygenase
MTRFNPIYPILVAAISIIALFWLPQFTSLRQDPAPPTATEIQDTNTHTHTNTNTEVHDPMLKATMSKSILNNAKITLRKSAERGHSTELGWLNSYFTFSFAGYYDPSHMVFGSLRVLNEDRVKPMNGFGTHRHANAEIFSYILSGELTHRDSMISKNEGVQSDKFFRMKRGDVQFTTGGRGIAHSYVLTHSTSPHQD